MSTYLDLNVFTLFAQPTKRAPLISEQLKPELFAYLSTTALNLNAQPLSVGGVSDHVHMLLKVRANAMLSDLIRDVKRSSSIWVSAKTSRPFKWQEGYEAFSVSQSDVPMMFAYIAKQEQHHLKLSSSDESRHFLAENEMGYEEKYFV